MFAECGEPEEACGNLPPHAYWSRPASLQHSRLLFIDILLINHITELISGEKMFVYFSRVLNKNIDRKSITTLLLLFCLTT